MILHRCPSLGERELVRECDMAMWVKSGWHADLHEEHGLAGQAGGQTGRLYMYGGQPKLLYTLKPTPTHHRSTRLSPNALVGEISHDDPHCGPHEVSVLILVSFHVRAASASCRRSRVVRCTHDTRRHLYITLARTCPYAHPPHITRTRSSAHPPRYPTSSRNTLKECHPHQWLPNRLEPRVYHFV